MHFISLDLEWNQAYHEQSMAVQRRLNCRLRGEVIQIGAVKLDSDMRICGSFSVIIKPKFFRRMQRHVIKLTGITQEQIDMGLPLCEAAAQFRRFCGEDCVLLTWGPDDVPMFTDNLRANGLDTEWMPKLYDLQVIYNMQTDKSSKQRSLEYAMEQLGLTQNLPAHDALNDALFTALVAGKLDMAKGIAEYDNRSGQYPFMKTVGNADVGEKGFPTCEGMLKLPEMDSPRCPACNKEMSKAGKLLHAKGQRYIRPVECREHGTYMLQLKAARNLDGTLRGKITMEQAQPEALENYRAKLKASESAPAKSRRRRHRGKSRKKSASSAPTE